MVDLLGHLHHQIIVNHFEILFHARLLSVSLSTPGNPSASADILPLGARVHKNYGHRPPAVPVSTSVNNARNKIVLSLHIRLQQRPLVAFQYYVLYPLPGIRIDGMCNIPIFIPRLEEQKNIGKKIEILSEKIDIETRLLLCLKNQKQYFLSQMFI